MITREYTELRPTADDVEAALRRRARRLTALIGQRQGGSELSEYIKNLLTGKRLAFAVKAIQADLDTIGPTDPPLSATKLFPGWFIAVTVWPGQAPADLHRRPGGYLGLLASLTAPAYEVYEGRHVAHWVVSMEKGRIAVRLAVFPNHRTSGAPLLIPLDLLTPQERDLLRLPEETDANREPELSPGR